MLSPSILRGSARPHVCRRAFTLIELLTVIAVIAVLAGIAYGVVGAVKQRAAVAQSTAELAVLALALDDYKRAYGDYPQTATTSALLYQALDGKLGPTGAALTGRRFITVANFHLNDTDVAKVDDTANYLVDPWSNAYRYVYYYSATTGRRGFVLYCLGPDGTDDTAPSATDGTYDATTTHNIDNLYVSR
jgi:prepilin-type N-terminal cleavage/methylation domain-containing protein